MVGGMRAVVAFMLEVLFFFFSFSFCYIRRLRNRLFGHHTGVLGLRQPHGMARNGFSFSAVEWASPC